MSEQPVEIKDPEVLAKEAYIADVLAGVVPEEYAAKAAEAAAELSEVVILEGADPARYIESRRVVRAYTVNWCLRMLIDYADSGEFGEESSATLREIVARNSKAD